MLLEPSPRRFALPYPSTTVFLAILFLIPACQSIQAQVTGTETKLVFNSLQTDASQRTFSVKGTPLPKLAIARHDLVDKQTSLVLLTNQITATSTRDDVSNQEVFTVTISGGTKPGHYVGNLDVMDIGKTPYTKLLSIELDVTLRAVPAVEADVNSKALTLKLRQPLTDFPFIGQPSAYSDGDTRYARDVFLIQPGSVQASVRSAAVLGMKGTNDVLLPAGVVRVSGTFPVNIPGGSSATVRILAGGNNVSAGEYNGSMQVWVVDQASPLQIPIKLLIKDGPVVAFFVLVFGLLAAALFGWWNAKGQGVNDIIKSLEKLAAKIKNGEKLQAAERTEATRLVKETMESIEAGEAATEVKKKHDAAEAYITSTIAQVDKFLAEQLAPLQLTTEKIEPGASIRNGFLATLDEIKRNLVAGKYPSLASADKLLSDPQKGLIRKIDYFDTIAKKYSDAADDKKAELHKKMEEATTMAGLISALKEAGIVVTPEPGMSFAAAAGSVEKLASYPVIELSLKRQLQLSLGAAAVSIIVFLFVLAVGWISIYVRADIFGANPMDYITIFLWGATAEAVRGQTVSLTALKTVVQEKPGG